jgi:ABC-type thiamine transport system ATPase subunit
MEKKRRTGAGEVWAENARQSAKLRIFSRLKQRLKAQRKYQATGTAGLLAGLSEIGLAQVAAPLPLQPRQGSRARSCAIGRCPLRDFQLLLISEFFPAPHCFALL